MVNEPHPWVAWADNLQRWGLAQPLAVLLEALGPFRWLVAQFLYGSLPLFTTPSTSSQWQAILRVLEDETAHREFINLLLEESRQ
ncbi:hypothetical protein [uncultured Thermanaerothrix sp.]|uniref:hypothetical protein n=1 Tax=uncultured Thermanaerothrix sp. TaxID=1195149 RepID=UPI0026056190|nr:hypothetical protein [uncultured Thermanaerothrix sp.]